MSPTKITINRLDEEQMQEVRDYLARMPNAIHKEGEEESYGRYIKVTADVQTSIDEYTAKKLPLKYKNVTFEVIEIPSIYYDEEDTAKRNTERNEVVKGLASLIIGFL